MMNVLLPFTLAYGLQTANDPLVAAAERAWDGFPAPRGNAITEAMLHQLGGTEPGAPRVRTGRLQQGLLALYHDRCRMRQCDTCPVHALAALGSDLTL